ncbi:MAG: hypothetical protein II824_07280 [Bacteroidales bacterium]|nr:hypothetical protein [Bacteroidales bacterium]
MRTLYLHIILAAFLLVAGLQPVRAQDLKTVSGTITSAEDGSPLADGITVYTYMTTAEAQDDYTRVKQMLEENSAADYLLSGIPHSTLGNYYSVQVPASGALLFFYEDARVVRMEEVKGRLEINVSLKVARQLQKAVVEAESTKPYVTLEAIPISGDNEIESAFTFLFSGKATGRADARFAIQAYLLDENKVDTLQYFTPVVLDGEKYHLTQLRRKNFDPKEDYLYRRASEQAPLSSSTESITYPFKFKLQDRSDVRYFCYKYWMEDYNHVFVQDSAQVFSTARLQDPMQFLEYDLGTYELNPKDFFVDAQRERHNGKKELPLRFMVGRSRIDPSDTTGLRLLAEIKEEMSQISQDPDATLKELHISGVASPEGNYARNTELAQDRMNFLLDNILSVLSTYDRARVYKSGKSRVATWEEVAQILDRDSLTTLASEVRDAVANARGGMDTQFARIQRLSEYRDQIVPRLPALRTVTCTYLSEVYRKLLPEEVLEKYQSDPDYREGRKKLTLNEFWNLYQMLSDPDELEGLYKRGIRAAGEMNYFWPLPANKLASAYIKKDIVDTTLLKPYLHEGYSVNRPIMSMQDPSKYERIWNLDPVVANQVIMLLNAKSSTRAVFWATYLKDLPQYHTLYHIARCLAGYYQVNTEEGRETFQVVSRSSKLNEAVMNMAIQSWSNAEKALRTLPQEEARTQYLWAQFLARKYGGGRDYGRMREEVWGTDEFGLDLMVSDAAKEYLKTAIQLDDSYLLTAQKDAYLPEDLVTEVTAELEKKP